MCLNAAPRNASCNTCTARINPYGRLTTRPSGASISANGSRSNQPSPHTSARVKNAWSEGVDLSARGRPPGSQQACEDEEEEIEDVEPVRWARCGYVGWMREEKTPSKPQKLPVRWVRWFQAFLFWTNEEEETEGVSNLSGEWRVAGKAF